MAGHVICFCIATNNPMGKQIQVSQSPFLQSWARRHLHRPGPAATCCNHSKPYIPCCCSNNSAHVTGLSDNKIVFVFDTRDTFILRDGKGSEAGVLKAAGTECSLAAAAAARAHAQTGGLRLVG